MGSHQSPIGTGNNDLKGGDLNSYSYDPYGFLEAEPVLSSFLIIVLVLASVVGTGGNVLILVSVATQRDLRNVDSVFIVNLACADLYVTLIADPLSIVGKTLGWQFFAQHDRLCQAVGSLCTVSCVASLLTLSFISLNRYLLIANPPLYRRLFTLRATVLLCVSFYLVGFLLCVLNFAGVGSHSFDHRSLECIWDRMANHDYTRVFSITVVLAPILMTGLCYCRLYLRVRGSRMKIHHHHSHEGHQHHRRRSGSHNHFNNNNEVKTQAVEPSTSAEVSGVARPSSHYSSEGNEETVMKEKEDGTSELSSPEADQPTSQQNANSGTSRKPVLSSPSSSCEENQGRPSSSCGETDHLEGPRSAGEADTADSCSTNIGPSGILQDHNFNPNLEGNGYTRTTRDKVNNNSNNPSTRLENSQEKQSSTAGATLVENQVRPSSSPSLESHGIRLSSIAEDNQQNRQQSSTTEDNHQNRQQSSTAEDNHQNRQQSSTTEDNHQNRQPSSTAEDNHQNKQQRPTKEAVSEGSTRLKPTAAKTACGRLENNQNRLRSTAAAADEDVAFTTSSSNTTNAKPPANGRHLQVPANSTKNHPKASARRQGKRSQEEGVRGSTVKLARTLFIIYVMFSACWVPFAVLMIMEDRHVVSNVVHLLIVGWAHMHPSLNWFVYYHTHSKFRAAFRKLLCLDTCCR